MSIYAVNLVAKNTARDPEFRDRLGREPEAALADFELSDAEREALLAGDVAALYTMGAHEYLLVGLARFKVLGLDIPTFSERIRSVEPRLIY